MVASGIRLGTPALTTRGMKEAEMDQMAAFIARVLASPEDARVHAAVKAEVAALCQMFPLYIPPAESEIGRRGGVQRGRSAGARAAALRAAPGSARHGAGGRRDDAGGGVLLAEAGTGTGKTLAYLVPAILSGQRVLISTGTKNLQEQIYFKDLPVLERALDVRFTATYMKGRANYLCLHRLGQARSQSPTAEIDAIARWAETSDTGDRAELEDLPEHSPLWNEVAATAETCLGSDCPQFQECFVTRMRQRAAASDLVIVNHHLLCADAAVRQSSYGEVIPTCHYAIVDEAHQLEDVATQYFGISVSNYRLDDLGRDVERVLNAGVIADDDATIRRQVRRVDDHGRAFFGGLTLARTSRAATGERLRIGPDWYGDILDDGLALVSALDGLESVVQLAAGGATAPDASEDVLSLAGRAGEIRNQLRFLMAAADPRHVYFVETRGRGVFLRAAPIDVADILEEVLFERMRATILTSATLTVEGSFAYIRGRWASRRPPRSRSPPSSTTPRRQSSTCPAACPRPSHRTSATPWRARRWRSCAARGAGRSCCSPATGCCAQCTSGSRRCCPIR